MPIKHTFKAKGNTWKTMSLGPAKAIQQFCFQCYGWDGDYHKEVKLCPSEDCALWPFRVGKDPGRRITEKQRETGRQRMAALWATATPK